MASANPPLPHRAILGLAVTQIVGWGSTYYLPSVLAAQFRAELGMSQEGIFGGITVMLLVGAVAAPPAARLMERHGARWALVVGSVLMGLALVIISQARGSVTYWLAWVVIGVAAPAALSQGALTALAQLAGEGARRAIGRLLLVTGFSGTVFFPLTVWLDGLIGWRSACLAYAAVNLLVCAPLHAVVLAGPRRKGAVAPASHLRTRGAMRADREAPAFILAALAFSLAGVVSWGLGPLVVELLKTFGHADATAVFLGALGGPAAVLARVIEATVGQRAGILKVGLAALALLPVAVALPLFDDRSALIAGAFVIGYGMSAGAMTIVRSVLPLALFGADRYARLLGWFAVPQNIAFALAPMVFAGVMGSVGPGAVVASALAVAVLALAAMLALAILVRRSAVDRAA